MTLAKLKASPHRYGRGVLTEGLRQFGAETLGHLQRLRAAILELHGQVGAIEPGGGGGGGAGPRVVAFNAWYERGSSVNLHYVPWGNFSEATAGGADEEVVWIPPFGDRTIVRTVKVFSQFGGGETTITVRDFDEGVLASDSFTLGARDVATVDFGLELADGDAKLIGIDPTTAMQTVVVQLVCEEAAA